MALIVDQENLGTSEAQWRASQKLQGVDLLEPLHAKRILLVAPHPDDEVFGAGGLLQRAHEDDVPVEVIAVTDGEGSHPHLDGAQTRDLVRRRTSESVEALRRLGYARPNISQLHLPDSKVSLHRSALLAALTTTLRPGDWCVAPWRHDGHPDHDACGDAARQACESRGARMLSYLIWTWHWANPDDVTVPWESCRRLQLSRRERARKRWATMAFTSQISARDPQTSDEPVLPAPILRRFWRPNEVFIEESGGNDVVN
ncbi:MAG: PIG-L family deacetylase [Acidobacteria bacterium]|nr:PIG-L family deacetylase [Acidobacteriota bacterium]